MQLSDSDSTLQLVAVSSLSLLRARFLCSASLSRSSPLPWFVPCISIQVPTDGGSRCLPHKLHNDVKLDPEHDLDFGFFLTTLRVAGVEIIWKPNLWMEYIPFPRGVLQACSVHAVNRFNKSKLEVRDRRGKGSGQPACASK